MESRAHLSAQGALMDALRHKNAIDDRKLLVRAGPHVSSKI